MKSIYLRCLCSALLASVAAASCSVNDGVSEKMPVKGEVNIVAGYGEPSFTENFGLELALPVDETEFRSLLEAKNIEFRLIDSVTKNEILPLPRHRQGVGHSEFKKMYEIYGGVDADTRVGKRFRAYVDSSGMVVYIENAFSYTGP